MGQSSAELFGWRGRPHLPIGGMFVYAFRDGTKIRSKIAWHDLTPQRAWHREGLAISAVRFRSLRRVLALWLAAPIDDIQRHRALL
jgi:hypothetical protein